MHKKYLALLPLIVLLITCGPLSTPPATPLPPTAAPTPVPPTAAPEPTAAPTPAPTATPVIESPKPKRIEFKSADGTKLVGYYHPAVVENAPVIVLMHWAVGTQKDWWAPWQGVGLTTWLQNADGGKVDSLNGTYPRMPKGVSFAVFTFDFRSFGESEGKEDPQGWLQDAQAAVLTAQALPGVDPKRVSTIGASIGSDAAVDACAEGCLGALSLSPGNYLGVPYKDAVKALDKAQKIAWCVAGEGDSPSPETCESASGKLYKKVIYPGGDHGMAFFFSKGLKPPIEQVIFDFLTQVYGLK